MLIFKAGANFRHLLMPFLDDNLNQEMLVHNEFFVSIITCCDFYESTLKRVEIEEKLLLLVTK